MPTAPGMPSYLIPSYVRHTGGFACEKSKFCCYHPAIRIGPAHGGFIVWSTDACSGRSRNLALENSSYEIALARKRRVWPRHWNAPLEIARKDLPEFLQKLPPEQEKIVKVKTIDERQAKAAAELVMAEYMEKKHKPKSMAEILDEHAAKKAAEAAGAPAEEIVTDLEKMVDKARSQAYDPFTMFGIEDNPKDEPQPEQPATSDAAPTK